MRIHLPAVGPDLPIHPRTGLTALGLRRNGQPVWPVRGASPDDPGEPEGGEGDDPEVPEGTGDAGKQAIDRMKSERNAARTELRDAQAKLAEYQKAEQVKAEADKTEAERRAAAEQRAAEAELRVLKLDVAAEKAPEGMPIAQVRKLAARLNGATREELETDAVELFGDMPRASTSDRRAPRPDRSQGARGGTSLSGKEAGLAEAQKRFGQPASK